MQRRTHRGSSGTVTTSAYLGAAKYSAVTCWVTNIDTASLPQKFSLPACLSIGMTESPSGDIGVTYTLQDEDHTLANALRFMLNKNPHVEFVGYSIPHPSDPLVNLRIQTSGEISSDQAFKQALIDIKEICSHMKLKFEEAMEAWRSEEASRPQTDVD